MHTQPYCHTVVSRPLNLVYAGVCTSPSSNPFLPATVFLAVVVLLLITCVALLVLALAVTATKLNKLRAEKGHTDPPHCNAQTNEGEGKTTEEIYEEMGDGMGPTQQQRGLYQELTLGTMEKEQYEVINRKDYTAKA